MNLQELSGFNVKSLKSEIPEAVSETQRRELERKIKELVGQSRESKQVHNTDLLRLLELVEAYEAREDTSGFHKLFQPGTPYGIDKLPKHFEFFKATKLYRETAMLGGNRCGKTTLGATASAILATGQYPEWWPGVRYATPTHVWAVGKTGQTTRDTVQHALMGPIGAWGTGTIPKDCILRTTARAGIPSALDTVEVLHVSGKISTIGFKSYDQKPSSFYGTAKHLVWLDEPSPDLVYNECLIRTVKLDQDPIEGPKGGRLIHTLTPKEGLTRLIAEFLASCDLLAGADRIKGLDAMIKLQEMEDAKNDY